MICNKCGAGYMVDDSHNDVKVYKCWVCGNRLYVDHPKKWGYLVCCRCGEDVEIKNEWGYCDSCLRLFNLSFERTANAERTKERTYGKTTCTCGTTFVRKSPTQMFHAKECRRRLVSLQV
jgi:hypothetical protein